MPKVFAVAVQKKLFSFPCPQKPQFPLVEKEIAKKNSLRNNCIQLLSKGLHRNYALSIVSWKSEMNLNMIVIMRKLFIFLNIVWGKCHPIMDYGLFPSIHLSLILIHWKLYKRDLHDLYLIPRRQIYDQQFCHRPVTLQCLWTSGLQIIFTCQYANPNWLRFSTLTDVADAWLVSTRSWTVIGVIGVGRGKSQWASSWYESSNICSADLLL